MNIIFIIIKDLLGERISGSINKQEDQNESQVQIVQQVYINNLKNKRHYEKIRKMIGSYNKTLALLNMRNDDPSIVAVANLILHQVPYSIKYIDMTKIPQEIKYRHYNGVDKSFT
jgi:hypothetical protein